MVGPVAADRPTNGGREVSKGPQSRQGQTIFEKIQLLPSLDLELNGTPPRERDEQHFRRAVYLASTGRLEQASDETAVIGDPGLRQMALSKIRRAASPNKHAP